MSQQSKAPQAPAPKQEQAAAPVFPDRDAWKRVELTRNSRADELQGREPGYHYEYFSEEADHPSYVGSRLRRHEIGDQRVGYKVVEAWETCKSTDVHQADARTDQGKPVDGLERRGRKILCRIPLSEYAKYEAVDKRRAAARHNDLFKSPDRVGIPGAQVTTINSEDPNAVWQTELKRAGHEIVPGQGV